MSFASGWGWDPKGPPPEEIMREVRMFLMARRADDMFAQRLAGRRLCRLFDEEDYSIAMIRQVFAEVEKEMGWLLP